MKEMIYFGAEWCAACKQMLPEVERAAKKKMIRLRVFHCEHSEALEMSKKEGVNRLPTLIIRDILTGAEERLEGYHGFDQIVETINGL